MTTLTMLSIFVQEVLYMCIYDIVFIGPTEVATNLSSSLPHPSFPLFSPHPHPRYLFLLLTSLSCSRLPSFPSSSSLPHPPTETHNGAPVKNAWKMDNRTKGKDYVIYAKTSEAKEKWMDAFERARERVREDRENGKTANYSESITVLLF